MTNEKLGFKCKRAGIVLIPCKGAERLTSKCYANLIKLISPAVWTRKILQAFDVDEMPHT
jgi:hypothetical protein